MGLIQRVLQSAPWLCVVGAIGLIFVSLVSCAVSEAAARVATWLYSGSPELRALRREEWICQLDEMRPSERPMQAGSMLWLGLRRLPSRIALPARRPAALGRFSRTVASLSQAERLFGLPVLTEVPRLAPSDRLRAAVVSFEQSPLVARSYRALRTALLVSKRPSTAIGGQVVVVTSPKIGYGTSATAANLAMAYAETLQSVLLVSWNLWRPLSPAVFDAEDGPGVADYLDSNTTSLVRYVQDTSIPGLRIVTAGLGGVGSNTQLESARRLLEEARMLANVVIVDTAPVLGSRVTQQLVTLADAVVVVCSAGQTTAQEADQSAELLERLGSPTMGLVLVDVPWRRFARSTADSPPPPRRPRLGPAGLS